MKLDSALCRHTDGQSVPNGLPHLCTNYPKQTIPSSPGKLYRPTAAIKIRPKIFYTIFVERYPGMTFLTAVPARVKPRMYTKHFFFCEKGRGRIPGVEYVVPIFEFSSDINRFTYLRVSFSSKVGSQTYTERRSYIFGKKNRG